MRNGNLLTTLAVIVAPFLCPAQSTVNFSAGFGERNIMDVNNQPLADGNSVWIGFFDSGFDVGAASGNLNTLNAAWNLLTKDTIETIFGSPGTFAGSGNTSDPTFNNSQIWFWVFQTSDNGTPDGSFGNVVGYGLFSGSDPSWQLPPQGLAFPFNTTSVDSTEVDTAHHGSFDDNHLILHPIPEPSTVGLMFLGLGCLSFHLWRRQPANPFHR